MIFFNTITVLSNERKVNLPEFYSYLIAHEAQAASMNTTVEYTSSANNATRHEPNAPRHNNNNGHNNSNQRNNYCGGKGRGRGRECGRNNRGLRCQVCSIPGHTALNCYNRFNHAYQVEEYRSGNSVTTGGYNPKSSWYIDTGAINHLTSDLDRLTIQECYHGKDQVQVANGAGLSISHIGHSIIPGLG